MLKAQKNLNNRVNHEPLICHEAKLPRAEGQNSSIRIDRTWFIVKCSISAAGLEIETLDHASDTSSGNLHIVAFYIR